MVKIYGQSDAEKDFLKYVNDIFRRIRISDVYQYNDFKQYPHKYKNQILNNFDQIITPINSKISFFESQLSHLRKEERMINCELSRKMNIVKKYYGRLKDQINLEIEDLKNQKEFIARKITDLQNQLIDLKYESYEQSKKKQQAICEIDQDIATLDNLNNDFELKNRLKGAWGEKKVIESIKTLFKKEKDYHLINAFDITVLGNPIAFDEKILVENKIDHLLVCPKGVFILETKSWSQFDSYGKEKCINQLKKSRTVLESFFDENLTKFFQYVIVTTETKFDLTDVRDYYSVHLSDLKDFLERFDTVFSRDDITLTIDKLLPYLNESHLDTSSKTYIKMKTQIINGKRFVKRILKTT